MLVTAAVFFFRSLSLFIREGERQEVSRRNSFHIVFHVKRGGGREIEGWFENQESELMSFIVFRPSDCQQVIFK